jgi:predicted dehydrogenase
MDKVRLAIQGSGIIARYHARAIRETPGVELVAAANWREESLAKFAKEWDIPCTTTSFEELAQDKRVDGVINCLPNFLHRDEAIRMLKAGKHVLLEKPMAMNAAEAEEILKVAKEEKRCLLVGQMWRFDNEVGWLRGVIASGLLGDIVRAKAYAIHPAGYGPKGWAVQKDKAGGGVVMDMGIHAVDVTRFLLGEAKPTRVYAHLGTRFSSYDVEDEATFMIDWDNGTTSTIITAGWQPHDEAPEGGAEVWGTKGYGRTFPTQLRLPIAGVNGFFTPVFPARMEQCDWPMYQKQIAHFAECIREGKEPNPGGEEGLLMMKVMDAVYESAQTGEPVTIK